MVDELNPPPALNGQSIDWGEPQQSDGDNFSYYNAKVGNTDLMFYASGPNAGDYLVDNTFYPASEIENSTRLFQPNVAPPPPLPSDFDGLNWKTPEGGFDAILDTNLTYSQYAELPGGKIAYYLNDGTGIGASNGHILLMDEYGNQANLTQAEFGEYLGSGTIKNQNSFQPENLTDAQKDALNQAKDMLLSMGQNLINLGEDVFGQLNSIIAGKGQDSGKGGPP